MNGGWRKVGGTCGLVGASISIMGVDAWFGQTPVIVSTNVCRDSQTLLLQFRGA